MGRDRRAARRAPGAREGLHPERVPGAEHAEIPPGKIAYLLESPGKRRFFHEILAFDERTASDLERQLVEGLPHVSGRFAFVNPAGRPQWVALMEIAGPTRTAMVFTVWQLLEPARPALGTARPVKRKDRLLFE